ncbi:hypothetical protein ACEQ8H_001968 [Pleosporales sp. CAS-2024a]
MTPVLPLEEAVYFIEKSRSALVLVSSFDLEKRCQLEKRIAATSNEHFRGVTPTLDPSEILISSHRPLAEVASNSAVVVSTKAPDGSVDEIVSGIDVKLSEGDEGEVLVKSPHMFSKASLDMIKSGGYKISALDIERELLGLADHVLTIADVRRHLRERLAGYKLPTILQIVNGELPKTATGKVQEKVLGTKFFPADYTNDAEVQ